MIRYWSHLNLAVAFLHYTSTISVQYVAAFNNHKPYVWHTFRNHATRYIYTALLETPGASLTNNWNGYYVLCSYYNELSRHSCYLDPSLIGSHVIAWPRLWPTHKHRHGWTKKMDKQKRRDNGNDYIRRPNLASGKTINSMLWERALQRMI